MTYEFELVKMRLLTIGDQIKGGGKWSFQGSNEPPKQAPKKKENEKELCIIIFDRKAGR